MKETKNKRTLLKRINVDMVEVERGAESEMVKRPIDEYIFTYGIDITIAKYVERYDDVVRRRC